MTLTAVVIGFLKALPDLIGVAKEFMIWLNRASGNDPVALVKRVGEVMVTLNAAQSVEERENASKAIASVISSRI